MRLNRVDGLVDRAMDYLVHELFVQYFRGAMPSVHQPPYTPIILAQPQNFVLLFDYVHSGFGLDRR